MICLEPFKNLSITTRGSLGLDVAPCCTATAQPTSIVNFYDNAYLNKFRTQIKLGQWPAGCESCKRQEDAGIMSRRQGSAQWYDDAGITDSKVELIRLDYWVGNTCNLACVICGPANSTTWKNELGLSSHGTTSIVNKFWNDLDLTSLKFIHFHGGEPLLNKDHVKLLAAVPDKQQVQITYNTNGTVQASQELLDIWAEFQLVEIDFSIDDIGKRFEYQRYPAVWTQTVDNLHWFINSAPHNTIFNINTTISWLNCFSIDSTEQWLRENFYVSKFNDPIQMRKQLAVGKFSIEQPLSLVKTYLDEIDARRGTNWRATFPELDVSNVDSKS